MRLKPITDPATGRFIANDPMQRLMQFRSIDPDTGCWNWTGSIRRPSGYGTVCIQRRELLVHRLAAALWLGFDINSRLKVCHTCDNRRCFNPAHLFTGTSADNNADRDRKGRTVMGVQHSHAKLTPDDVRAIREHVANGAVKTAIGREFGISATHVTHIAERRGWKHVA